MELKERTFSFDSNPDDRHEEDVEVTQPDYRVVDRQVTILQHIVH